MASIKIKRSKIIEALDARRLDVAWPRYSGSFQNYSHDFREVVRENFGYSDSKKIEYDDEHQLFYWQHEASTHVLNVGETRILFELRIEIDPKCALAPQISAALFAIAKAEDHYHLVFQLLKAEQTKGALEDQVGM